MLDSRISDIWLKTLKTEDYELYLHSPFCVKGCKYCVYTGKLITDKNYKDVYKTYVDQYLPEAINNYQNILSIKPANNLYFGGGTPNLFKPEDIEKTLRLIPNYGDIKNKIADIHPAYLNDKTLYKFIELGFNTLCFGVQSFDNETLIKNNRDPIKLDRLKEIIKICKDNNVYTSIDLMCYLNNYNSYDIDILKKDLDIAIDLDLDFIAINPNLHFILHEQDFSYLFENFMDIYTSKSNSYISEKELNGSKQLNERFIYRIVNRNIKDIYNDKILNYFADDFPLANNNIIGIGDLNNPHSTMSYIHKRLYYTERNIDNHPYYDIQYYSPDAQDIDDIDKDTSNTEGTEMNNLQLLKMKLNKYIK